MNMQKLNDLVQVVKVLRDTDSSMTIQQLEVLLRVAVEEGIGVRAMTKRTGQTQSSSSRNMRMFTAHYTPTQEGLGLLEWRQDPTDFRAKGAYLTPKGKDLMDSITSLL